MWFKVLNLQAIVSLIGLFAISQAYWIDPVSCTGDQLSVTRDGINGALLMLTTSVANLREDPISPALTRLLRNLFGPDTARGARLVLRAFENVLESAGTPDLSPTKPILGFRDIRFYCDMSRFKLRLDDRKLPTYYNTHTEEILGKSVKVDCTYVFAWTMCPQYAGEPCEVQICPWFLLYAVGKKYHRWTDWFRGGLIAGMARLVDETIANRFYTPVDFVQLFDKVILHEMMHTRGAVGDSLLGGPPDDVGGARGYGWKNCRELSTVVTDLRANPVVLGPEKNAALFGSCAMMISRGVVINDNGTFSAP